MKRILAVVLLMLLFTIPALAEDPIFGSYYALGDIRGFASLYGTYQSLYGGDMASWPNEAKAEISEAASQIVPMDGCAKYGIPKTSDISAERATELAKGVLRDGYHLAYALLDGYTAETAYDIGGSKPVWMVRFTTQAYSDDAAYQYEADIDAATGKSVALREDAQAGRRSLDPYAYVIETVLDTIYAEDAFGPYETWSLERKMVWDTFWREEMPNEGWQSPIRSLPISGDIPLEEALPLAEVALRGQGFTGDMNALAQNIDFFSADKTGQADSNQYPQWQISYYDTASFATHAVVTLHAKTGETLDCIVYID